VAAFLGGGLLTGAEGLEGGLFVGAGERGLLAGGDVSVGVGAREGGGDKEGGGESAGGGEERGGCDCDGKFCRCDVTKLGGAKFGGGDSDCCLVGIDGIEVIKEGSCCCCGGCGDCGGGDIDCLGVEAMRGDGCD